MLFNNDMKRLLYILFLFFCCLAASAQTDDLMILEYLDSYSGNGGAIKIYNPTLDTIDLSDYDIRANNNGGGCVRTTPLSGSLPPGEALIGYFGSYITSNNCPPGDFNISTCGWNGDDHIGIRKNGAYVDMINNPTVANGPNVNGTFNGLLKTHIIRQNSNCIRYTSTNASDPNSWPADPFSVVSGWDVFSAQGSCIDSITNFNPTSDTTYVTDTICSGDSLLIAGVYRDTVGVYYDKFPGVNVCDSVVELTLTVLPAVDTTIATTICSGDSIQINGRYYNTAGTYSDTLSSQLSGCDSILNINITLLPVVSTNDTVFKCPGDSINISGNWITAPGEYRDTLATSANCDSVIITQVYNYPTRDTVLSQSICQGDTVVIGGSPAFASGTYYDTIPNSNGCDSVVTVNLNVLSQFQTNDTLYTCPSIPVLVHGSLTSTPGEYRDTLTTANGCDSILVTQLYNYSVQDSTIDTTLCYGDTIFVGGLPVFASGTYSDTVQSSSGCDSILTVNLTVLGQNLSRDTIYTCPGESIIINGNPVSTPGEYRETYTGFNGCDSLHIIQLYNYVVRDSIINISSCLGDTILVGGQPVYTSGTYYDTVQTAQGCDSLLITNVTFTPADFRQINRQICEGGSTVVNGITFTSDTVFSYRKPGVPGIDCDSIINVSIQTIEVLADFDWSNSLADSSVVFFQNWSQNADSYEWFFGDGDKSRSTSPSHRYTKGGVYQVTLISSNNLGCSDIKVLTVTIPEEEVIKLFIPNSFTPNGDGLNEEFLIGYTVSGIPFRIEIFSRWGEQVFSSNRMDFRWDGTFKGEPCMEGVYTFRITGFFDKKGFIHLIR